VLKLWMLYYLILLLICLPIEVLYIVLYLRLKAKNPRADRLRIYGHSIRGIAIFMVLFIVRLVWHPTDSRD